MKARMLAYSYEDSPIHRLTGASKLIFFILWALTIMLTYDTRSLLCLLVLSLIIFKVSKVKFSDISFVLYLILFFLLLNHIAIFAFSPLEGVKIYGTRHDLFHIFGRYDVTVEQIFYQFNITLKYFTLIPMILIFLKTTPPSEFAASLNQIGMNYKIAYAISLTMRYIPDVQLDFQDISFAQQARGIDMSSKEKLLKRLKNVSAILWPLIFSSLERIETISAAMELRGFGHKSKRTWYSSRPLVTKDYLVIIAGVVIMISSTVLTFYDGGRFYNPFIGG
jgi:energy-coupling factor transport system permease protein